MATQFLLLFLPVLILAQGTTVTSIPYFTYGGAVAFGEMVFAAVGTSAFFFDAATGVWTTTTAPPVTAFKGAVASLTGFRAVLAGGSPSLGNVHIFDLQTEVWSVKPDLPIGVHSMASDSDGRRVWLAGGFGGSDLAVVQEYDSDTDTWTSKSQLPFGVDYICGTYWSGFFFVLTGFSLQTYVYTVAADTWTTVTSAPSVREGLYDAISAITGYAFVVGAVATGNEMKVERYDFGNDVWTSLDPTPRSSSGAATAITTSGRLVVVGFYPSGKYAHTFVTGLPASPAGASGDPLFHTFTGPPVHLSLGTSVFNFLTTPTIVVNALVEEFPSLPPEDNTLITTLAVVAEVDECLLLSHCSVHSISCSVRVICQQQVPQMNLSGVVEHLGHGLVLSVGGLVLEVHLSLLEYSGVGAITVLNATYINFWVHPPAPSLVISSAFGGIIGDLCSHGLPHVMDQLVSDAYTVDEGCLFAIEVKATAGLFSETASRLALDEC